MLCLGGEVQLRVVVTVPAHFRVLQRADTRAAVLVAEEDADDMELLEEPCAAATACWEHIVKAIGDGAVTQHKKTVMVVDIGGGTLDVTVVTERQRDQASPDLVVLTLHGMDGLGGEVFTCDVAEHLAAKLGLGKLTDLPQQVGWGGLAPGPPAKLRNTRDARDTRPRPVPPLRSAAPSWTRRSA